MKFTIKKTLAAVAAAAMMAAVPMSASAATKEDVVQAARDAGFLEEYVQKLANYLKVTPFNSEQYDKMISKLQNVGSQYDELALEYFGKTVEELRTPAPDDDGNDSDGDDNTLDPEVQKKLAEIAKKMTNKDREKIFNELIEAGKEIGVDVSFEKKGDNDYIVTVKDEDGNVQFVAPIGKLVDTTGAEEDDDVSIALVAAVFGGSAALGCAGAYVLAAISKKKED